MFYVSKADFFCKKELVLFNTGIEQRSKVRYLSEVIKTTSLNSVKTRIMSYESLRQGFDRCVTLYNDFVKQSSVNDRQSLGIAATSTNNSGGTKSVTFSPQYLYYNLNEWYALSNNDKDKVLKARSNTNGGKKSAKSGGQPNSGGGDNNGKWKSKISMLEKKVRNHKSRLSYFNTSDKPGPDDEESDGLGK